MVIVPVGDTNRLFHITDVLPDSLFKNLLQVAWDAFPWQRISNQSHLLRRQLELGNMPDTDGTQPLLWHGMTTPVPADQFRISSYSLLGVYSQ